MPHDLIFLHTASSHIDTFNTLAERWLPGVCVAHQVEAGLLAEAQREGLTYELIERVQRAVRQAGEQAAVVCCTCSTLGDAAERTFMGVAGKYSIRIDRAMADQAVVMAAGKRIQVLAALATTLEPTEQLLRSSAHQAGVELTLQSSLVDGAWAEFEAGDLAGYYQRIAMQIDLLAKSCELVVLAQASMAPAIALCETAVPVLSSPALGVRALASLLNVVGNNR